MRHTERKPIVFVIFPFKELFDDVYHLGIRAACNEAGALCTRVDGPGFSSNVLAQIERHIRDADAIVADLTDKDPNVLYEFGYAYSLNKKVILLARNLEDIPFDLRHHPVVIYGGDIRKLRGQLTPVINEFVREVKEPSRPAPGDRGERGARRTPPDSANDETRGGAVDDARAAFGPNAGEDERPRVRGGGGDLQSKGVELEEGSWSEGGADAAPGKTTPGQVFISYSHDDSKWLDMLLTMSKPLVWSGEVDLWNDTRIRPGEKWEEKIAQALASARVAILLVSPAFLASDFIMKKELPYILEAAESDRLTLLWVPLRTCFFDKTKIAVYEATSDPSKPLDTLRGPKRNQALRGICEQIGMALGL